MVDKPAYLRLKGNITFNPKPQDNSQPDSALGAFSMGFFSAISLTGRSIVLDLNGFTF